MKRRMLSILCALALCLGLLPATAWAAAPTTLTVGGTDVLSGSYWLTNADDGTLTDDGASESDYNVKYDSATGTLTLKDATINGTATTGYVGAGIYAVGDLTIVLEGSSTVTGADAGGNGSNSIRVDYGNLTIQGGGSLTAQGAETSSGSSYGIFVIGSFTQQSGSVTAIGGDVSGSYNSTGLYVSDGTVTAQDGTLTATGGDTSGRSYGISMLSPSSVTVGSAAVTATGGTGNYSYGLYVNPSSPSVSPSVTLSGSGSLTARSGSATKTAGGIYFDITRGSTGSVTVGDNSTLLANSVILYDKSYTEKPLAPTGDGSWLIYGQSDQTSAVGGTYTLEENITIPSGAVVTIPAGSTLTVPQGKTLTVNGTLNIANQSSLTGSGSLAGSGTFNLTNPDPVISGSETLTYDGTDQFSKFKPEAPTGTVTVMGKDFAISSSPSLDGWTLETKEIKNAGTYTLTASNGTTTIEKEITVSPATISITSATVQDKTYDGTTDAMVESVTFDNLVNGESLSLGTDYTATATFADKNVGDSKSATVTVELKNGNYTFADDKNTAKTTATAAIQKATLTVTAPSKTIYVGEAVPDLSTLQATVTGLVGEDSLTGVTLAYKNAPDSSTTGTWAIVPSGGTLSPENQDNYDTEYISGALTVTTRPIPTYSVTVNGGTGGGSYQAGQTVTVTATVPEGMVFTGWTGNVTFADPAALSTTFSMPAQAVTVTANFAPEPEPEPERYTVTLSGTGTGATGGGSYEAGQSVTVTAGTRSGCTFTSWTAQGVTLSNPASATVTFTMPENAVTLTAAWTANQPTNPGGGSSSSSDDDDDYTPPTTTEKNPDGSTTTTTTSGGTKTETTKYPDGSQEVVKTEKDGTVTTTTTNADGSKTETVEQPDGTVTTTSTDTVGNKTEVVENPDGTSETTITQADGSGSTTTVSDTGKVESSVTLPAAVVDSAAEKGEAVALPMPSVPVTSDRENAPTVTVDLPSGTTAKVEIPVENVTAGTVAVIVKADGTEEVIKTSLTTETGVAVTLSDGDTVKVVDNSKTFDDVPGNYWGAEAVAFASSRELFAGTSATTFAPDTAMTRAMIVTVLARFKGVDTTTGSTWYEAGQQWAVENGISDGTNTDASLTREQLATMLWRYAGSPSVSNDLSNYTDAGTVSSYAQQAMAWCVEQGIIGGTTTTTLSPQGEATRAQVATILMRFIEGNQ